MVYTLRGVDVPRAMGGGEGDGGEDGTIWPPAKSKGAEIGQRHQAKVDYITYIYKLICSSSSSRLCPRGFSEEQGLAQANT